jgi:transcriptional/translational regulatory protein YebC/TACO1
MNTRLADAIARARKASMPKANIETAIARGQGLSVSGSKLEPFLEEASYPPGIAILVDVLTDNKQQAKIDIRKIFKFHGANLSNTAYLFEKRGQLVFGAKEGVDEESMLEEAVNVNALDVEMSESGWTVYTEIQDMTVVTEHLKNKLGLEIEESEIIWDAKDLIEVDDKAAVPLLDMIEKLKEIPSVKEIYTNAK